MKRKIAAIIAVLMLAGCSGTPPAETVQTDGTENALAEEFTSETASETISWTFSGTAVTTSQAEKMPDEEAEEYERPVVIPVNEVYEIFPTKLFYPEKQETAITAEKAEFREIIYYDNEVPILNFSAEYPVFSGGNASAMKKINDSIKAYIDSVFEEDRISMEEYDLSEESEEYINTTVKLVYGFLKQREILAGGYDAYNDESYDINNCYDINGNILSVYFMDFGMSAGAAHGYEVPVTMVFDLRTGDRVDFNDITEDKAGFSWEVHKALYMFLDSKNVQIFEDYFQEWLEEGAEIGEAYVQSEEDRMDFYNGRVFLDYNDANSRLIVRDGCLGYYLAPYEYGNYADGIRCIQLPISDILPYLNDKGKALFEGYVSAEAEPINIIEYKGERYFSTEHIFDFSNQSIDDGVYEFLSCFDSASVDFSKSKNLDFGKLSELDNISSFTLENCRDIDFTAIAKMKGLKAITLNNCEFDDISPLFGSGVKKIYGEGEKNISYIQKTEFVNSGGEYIEMDLIGPMYVNYKGREYVLPYVSDTFADLEISDRSMDDIDREFILNTLEDTKLYFKFIRCSDIDFEWLGKLDGIGNSLTLTECADIDFSAIAEMGNIHYLWLYNCDFDDISPLIGSGITSLYGEGENVPSLQAVQYEKAGGHISEKLIEGGKKNYTILK